jgi:hypothetical protein
MRIHNWIDYRGFQVARLMKQLVAVINHPLDGPRSVRVGSFSSRSNWTLKPRLVIPTFWEAHALALDYAASFGIGLSNNRKNRVLRVPATTFVITHSPSRSNHRDGFGFSEERSGRATEQVRLRASVTGSIENDRQAFVLDKASRDATRARSFSSQRAGTAD